jgi:hypothetical protein
VWIDAPTDGLSAPADRPLPIEGHAAYHGGVARVEIWVNGELHLIEEEPPARGNLVRFEQSWMPPGPGEYTVQVVAIGPDGAGSEPDSARVHVGQEIAEVTPTPTPTATPEPTEPPTSAPVAPAGTKPPVPTAVPPTPVPPTSAPVQPVEASFWADRDSIAAGECTTLHWAVEHATAVYLDGGGVVGHGSRKVCPGGTKTYTLHVDAPSGSVDKHVTIQVSAPADPKPPADTTGPPAPKLLKPPNKEMVEPFATTMLRWNPVSDPSGIAEYRVQIERPDANGKWQKVSGSPWAGLTETKLEFEIESGRTYRWRVRAVDKAGNKGPYSGWFEFTVSVS